MADTTPAPIGADAALVQALEKLLANFESQHALLLQLGAPDFVAMRDQARAALTTAAPATQVDALDAARYRWLAAYCRSTAVNWGEQWSIVVNGPAPKSHDSEDDFDAAIDAARGAQGESNG